MMTLFLCHRQNFFRFFSDGKLGKAEPLCQDRSSARQALLGVLGVCLSCLSVRCCGVPPHTMSPAEDAMSSLQPCATQCARDVPTWRQSNTVVSPEHHQPQAIPAARLTRSDSTVIAPLCLQMLLCMSFWAVQYKQPHTCLALSPKI